MLYMLSKLQDVHFILLAGSKFLNAFVEYLMNAVSRIEQKGESNKTSIKNLSEMVTRDRDSTNRVLEMMRRKQEMVLTKQDQLHSMLHGETALHERPPVFTIPPLGSPTPPFPLSRTIRLSESLSEAASALDSADLESILSNISFSPPDISLKPQIDISASISKHSRPAPSSTTVASLQPGAGGGFSTSGTLQMGAGGYSAAETSLPEAGSFSNFAAKSRWLFRFRNFAAGSRWVFRCRNFAAGS